MQEFLDKAGLAHYTAGMKKLIGEPIAEEAIEELLEQEVEGVIIPNGDDGATYTPAVSADGTLSWTNDKGLDNPEPVNIRGPKGEDGVTPAKGVDYFTAADVAGVAAQAAGIVTPDSIGAAPMEYTRKVGNPHNLLDNSDFRNPVNQRGQASYTSTGYSIDRWRLRANNGGTLEVNGANGCVRLNAGTSGINGLYTQVATKDYADKVKSVFGKPVTLAVKIKENTLNADFSVDLKNSTSTTSDGDGIVNIGGDWCNGTGLKVMSCVMPTALTNQYLNFVIRTSSDCTSGHLDIEWAALYEGEYTAENLPEYQPKGYGVELAECQRYYLPISHGPLGNGYTTNAGGVAYINIPTPCTMRITPSLECSTKDFTVRVGGNDYVASSISIGQRGNNCVYIMLESSSLPAKQAASVVKLTEGIALSADL